MIYQIIINGRLDSQWSNWFEGMIVSSENVDDTKLTGPVADQAALHGLFRRIRDLWLTHLSSFWRLY